MMQMRHKKTGSILNIREFFIVRKLLWEYYVTNDEHKSEDIQFCLVRGIEQELGDVSMSEVRPYIMTHININKNTYHEVMPAIGYEWVE